MSPAGSRARSKVNSGSTSCAVRLILLPAFEYSAVLSHFIKLSKVQFLQQTNLSDRLIVLRALRCDSPAKGASERSEAAPERELAQESKALLQQRSRTWREAVRSEVNIFHSKYCKSSPSAKQRRRGNCRLKPVCGYETSRLRAVRDMMNLMFLTKLAESFGSLVRQLLSEVLKSVFYQNEFNCLIIVVRNSQ